MNGLPGTVARLCDGGLLLVLGGSMSISDPITATKVGEEG